MLAGEEGGSSDHGRFVERVGVVVDIAPEKRGADFFSPDPVLIGLGYGLEARMEVWGALFDPCDSNVVREEAVQCLAQVAGGNRVSEVESGTNGESVDARVSAAAAVDLDSFAFDLREGGLDGALDGGQAGLDLPAVIGGAVVRNEDAQTPHGSGGARAGLHDGQTLGAKRAGGRLVGGDFEGGESDSGDSDFGAACAAIDDGGGGEDFGASGFEKLDNFAGAAASGDYVFDDQHFLAGVDGEAAAKSHVAFAVTLGKYEAHTEGAGNLVADDQTAHGWCANNVDREVSEGGPDLLTEG